MFRRLSEPAQDAVSITVNGTPVLARQGDTVAAAMLAAGLVRTRRSPVSGAPRAPFCLMGTCFECLVVVDDVPHVQACMTRVRAGMRVATQDAPVFGAGSPGSPDAWGDGG